MDTTTGKILTSEEVKKELEQAMLSTGKHLDLIRDIEANKLGLTGEMEMPQTDYEDAMAEFLPDIKPLKSLPDRKCKKCYGLGHTGKNLTTGKYVPCSCTQ